MTSYLDADLMPEPHPRVVDVTMHGTDEMVECMRDWIEEHAVDGIGFVVQEVDGTVHCRPYHRASLPLSGLTVSGTTDNVPAVRRRPGWAAECQD
ncbi:hypothetical protein ACH5AL_15120 [Actinacidiphila glaucinigra]|uniref:hypothetical protein n=1 Tax=Actinacidiphila glaucinigra TaxID=235986 RepID=UPI00378B82E8